MFDIHCHVIPEVDDGARNWEIALQMCAMAWQDGIEHIVATPHANDEYIYDRRYLEETLDLLRRKCGGQPALSLGCDFHFSFENIQDALTHPGRYTIGDTPYILIEFSDFSLPPSIDGQLAQMMNMGFRPILTHPERNPILQKTPDRVLEWARAGCVVQVTANSLTGRWGKQAEALARWLIDQNAVHVVATDAHSTNSRPPILSEAREQVRKMAGDMVAEALVRDNPRAIVKGELLPYLPEV
ncbi:MAG TPA: CpsB/CapC family capsule biosynthesis tyrosine phosphatase [Terriglobales bacterium]|nr:CpsB/CapC family capsule biosynthesis tyrosine phosphatase [Terriglobales bacterium]